MDGEESQNDICFSKCRAPQQTQRIKGRDVSLAPEAHGDKINEKRESTLLYLAVVPITIKCVVGFISMQSRHTKAGTAVEKPLFRNFQASSSKPAHGPNRREKTHTRNPIESAKEASLLRPGHPYPFSSEHLSSCLMIVFLSGFTKKLFLERAHVQTQDMAPRPHATC